MYGIVFAKRRFVVEEYKNSHTEVALYVVCDKWKEKPNDLIQDALFYTWEQAEAFAKELEYDRDYVYGSEDTDI